MKIKAAQIRALNDQFRQSFVGGRLMITPGVQSLTAGLQARLFDKVNCFASFTNDNDPHGEHDFGAIEIEGQRFFWKIDCYNKTLEFGSPDSANASVTTRVMTIMCANEY